MKEIRLGIGTVKETNEEDGFLGEVPVIEFITGDVLAKHSDESWVKFELDGKTLNVAKKPLRRSISWDQTHVRGAVFGNATVVIQGQST